MVWFRCFKVLKVEVKLGSKYVNRVLSLCKYYINLVMQFKYAVYTLLIAMGDPVDHKIKLQSAHDD